jgi:hypothetical protein
MTANVYDVSPCWDRWSVATACRWPRPVGIQPREPTPDDWMRAPPSSRERVLGASLAHYIIGALQVVGCCRDSAAKSKMSGGMVRFTSCVLVLLGLVTLRLHAQLSLQQKDETVMVAADRASILGRLAADTEPSPKASVALDAERAVLATLPPDFRESCDTMIDRWATDGHPQNKALLKVRDLGRPDGASGRFLALRCYSTLPGSEESYDERLAYLYESEGNLVLRIFSHGKDTPGARTEGAQRGTHPGHRRAQVAQSSVRSVHQVQRSGI